MIFFFFFFTGVEEVSMNLDKDLVTVKGTMDLKDLLPYLKDKLKRPVDIVPPKKDDGGGGGDKKEKEKEKEAAGGGGGDGGDKGKAKEVAAAETKLEVNKYESHGYSTPYTYYGVPVYNQHYANQDSVVPTTYYHQPPPGYGGSTSYVVEYHHQQHVPPPPPPVFLPTHDQMFSDENPNACSVM